MKYIFITLLAMTVACGSIPVEVSLDDADRDALTGVFDGLGGDDDSDLDGSSDDVDDDSTTGTITIDTTPSDGGDDRYFIGTFTDSAIWNSCVGFPNTMRLYSTDTTVWLENNKQDLIAKAVIFQDDTFDFQADMLDQFGRPSLELACTCSLVGSQYYRDELECDCEYGSTDCVLEYRVKE